MCAQTSVKSHTITPISTLLTLTLAWTPAKIGGVGSPGAASDDESLLSSERTVIKAVPFLICVFGPNNLVGLSQNIRKH